MPSSWLCKLSFVLSAIKIGHDSYLCIGEGTIRVARLGCLSAIIWQGEEMRVPVVSKEGEPLMPTTPARCRKMLEDGIAEKQWTNEGVFYIQMLIEVGDETQEMAVSIDPGSSYDGYCVSGTAEVALMGMAVLPSRVHKRMETWRMLRRNRRYRNCRRREARFNNRKKKEGWIAPSQLAKVQLRTRLMERLCEIFPITDIVIEDVKYNHAKWRDGARFSTVEIGKTRVYERARELAKLWKCAGWETAETREVHDISKSKEKDKLLPDSHANDAWAMICWLYGWKPKDSVREFYIWRRQECSKRQLHLQNPSRDGERRRYGGTTHSNSGLRKGDVISYRDKVTGYVGGWTKNGKVVSLVGTDGKRIRQAGAGTVELLRRSPNILTERRLLPTASSGVSATEGI